MISFRSFMICQIMSYCYVIHTILRFAMGRMEGIEYSVLIRNTFGINGRIFGDILYFACRAQRSTPGNSQGW